MISRRGLLIGLTSLIAAPAIVRVESIMPVRALIITDPWVSFQSWPIGATTPADRCIAGFDLLSRAQHLCAMIGHTIHIRQTRECG